MSGQRDNNMSHEEGQPEGVREGHQRAVRLGHQRSQLQVLDASGGLLGRPFNYFWQIIWLRGCERFYLASSGLLQCITLMMAPT